MPDVKIKGYSGEEKTYQNVEKVYFSSAQGEQKIPYTHGEAVSKTVEPDFAVGDMAVEIPTGELVTALTVKKPSTLVPENIAQGVTVAGVTGEFAGGGGALSSMGSALKYIIPVAASVSQYGAENKMQLGTGNVTIKQNSTLTSTEDVHLILYPKVDSVSFGSRPLGVISISSMHEAGSYGNGHIYWGAAFTLDRTGATFYIETSTKGSFASKNLGGQTTVSVDAVSDAFNKPSVASYTQKAKKWEGFILVYDYRYKGNPQVLRENNYIFGAGLTVL